MPILIRGNNCRATLEGVLFAFYWDVGAQSRASAVHDDLRFDVAV